MRCGVCNSPFKLLMLVDSWHVNVTYIYIWCDFAFTCTHQMILKTARCDVYTFIPLHDIDWIESLLNCNPEDWDNPKKSCMYVRMSYVQNVKWQRVSTTRKLILVQVGKSRNMIFWSNMWFQNCLAVVKIHDGNSNPPNKYLCLKS